MNTIPDSWKNEINARIISSTCTSLADTFTLIMDTLSNVEKTLRELRVESDNLMLILQQHSSDLREAIIRRGE